ncbi:MAG: hypothetical protein WBK88_03360 [Methanothrix sp.]
MLITIGSEKLYGALRYADLSQNTTYEILGLAESYDSLGLTESYSSLGGMASYESLGLSESYWSLGQFSSEILSGTFSASDRLEERSSCSFQVRDDFSVRRYRKGQPVTARNWITGERIVAGWINEVEEVRPRGTSALFHGIDVVDNHYLADKRIIAYSAVEKSCGAVIAEIWAEYLQFEGLVLGDVEEGPILSECIFSYVPAAEAFDELAENAGFTWWIDARKRIHFMARGNVAAPWDVTDSEALEGATTCLRGNHEYRNRQYVVGGLAATSEQTETFAGNGEQTTFTVAYPLKELISIKVNDVEETAGFRGDTGYDWYYSEMQNTINQDAAGTKLESTDVLEITYIGFYDVIAVVESAEAVLDRGDVEESTTGYVEAVAQMSQIQSNDAAEEAANAKLAKYATVGATLQFTTMKHGLAPGQLVKVTMARHDFDEEEMLIQEVETREEEGYNWYEVEAVSGPVGDSWQKFFARMAAGAKSEVKRSASGATLLIRMISFSKDWLELDDPNLFNDIYPDSGIVPDGDSVPSFDEDDRVKYCVLYVAGAEAYRKAITTIAGEDAGTNRILCITMITASEVSGVEVSHIGWWGGIAAASGAGTGIELDKQAYEREKTALEAWQIRKTDNRWS